MPILKNAKHERFAQGLAQGKSQAQAHTDAGYRSKAPNADASKLIQRVPSIAQRRDELLRERAADREAVRRSALDAAQYDETRVVLKLAETVEESNKIIQRAMQVEPVIDRDGKPVLVETPEGKLAVAYSFDASAANQAIANKIKALHLLGIDAGRFVYRHEHRRSPLDGLPPEAVRALEHALAIQLEPGKPGLLPLLN